MPTSTEESIQRHDRLEIEGLSLGHGTDLDGMTGVTVLLCPEGATAAADLRGSATATRHFDSLTRVHGIGTKVHGLVFAGGSAFGLSAVTPVVEHLLASGAGFDTGVATVPIVPGAVLFDLAFGDSQASPSPELALAAIASASQGAIACGSVGAGTGATVGKAAGVDRAMKGGFGFASAAAADGLQVAVAAAVNAYGDVRDLGVTGARAASGFLAGCRRDENSKEIVGSAATLLNLGPVGQHPWEQNTTLVAVLTNASLSKPETRKVSEMAFGGVYRSIAPAASLYDGDLVVTLATGAVAAHVHRVAVLAEQMVVAAIATAVTEADGFGLRPSWRDIQAAA